MLQAMLPTEDTMADIAERAQATRKHLEAGGDFFTAPWALEDFSVIADENEQLRKIAKAAKAMMHWWDNPNEYPDADDAAEFGKLREALDDD